MRKKVWIEEVYENAELIASNFMGRGIAQLGLL